MIEDAEIEFRILGPLEAVVDGRPVALGGGRQRAVLALLLTRANDVVSVDALIEELWSGAPPRTAGNTLRYYISLLRKALGNDRIVTRARGYAVRVEPGELDLERFERLVEQGGADRLREALELWRGAPLADFAYEPFAQNEIARLEELRVAALEERVEADLALGRHGTLVGELERLVRRHPLRERLHEQLMLALHRAGRQAEALEAYRQLRLALVEELGIEPGPSIQRLEKAILVQDPAIDLAHGHAEVRAIVVAPRTDTSLDSLLSLAEPLAAAGDHLVASCDRRRPQRRRVPAAQGGRQWYAATVRGVLLRVS